ALSQLRVGIGIQFCPGFAWSSAAVGFLHARHAGSLDSVSRRRLVAKFPERLRQPHPDLRIHPRADVDEYLDQPLRPARDARSGLWILRAVVFYVRACFRPLRAGAVPVRNRARDLCGRAGAANGPCGGVADLADPCDALTLCRSLLSALNV